jgi:hypothetical protein
MSQIHLFIEKYLAKFLAVSQILNPMSEVKGKTLFPPSSAEIEILIPFLQLQDLDPVIIGSIAVVKHLKITDQDIQQREFRPAHALEIFVIKSPQEIPEGWKICNEILDGLVWISPSGGFVIFSIMGTRLSDGSDYFPSIVKDLESVAMNCPVADVSTLFKMKLNSNLVKDLYDLMCLTRRVGIPKNLEDVELNKMQAKNLDFLKRRFKL